MPQMKTKRTLLKRVKITKSGKIRKKSVDASHLRRKWSTNKRHRKNKTGLVTNKGHRKMFKKLLGKHGKRI